MLLNRIMYIAADASSVTVEDPVKRCQGTCATCRNSCETGDSVCGSKCLGNYERCFAKANENA